MNDKELYEQILKELENELWEIDNHYSISENAWSNLGVISRFIENMFNPKPYKLEELHEDMWIYDIKYDEFCRIDFIAGIYPHRSYSDGTCEDGAFEENRFYPPNKANQGVQQ